MPLKDKNSLFCLLMAITCFIYNYNNTGKQIFKLLSSRWNTVSCKARLMGGPGLIGGAIRKIFTNLSHTPMWKQAVNA